ncbi:MAG: hypothetical protein RMJ00_03000 [Nitrososphaerota archaeon]|nr:hypothetical protein [Candidatus Bathyarchaeota archaeon]MCX8161657.1 hypothetical protein [Candidatus Bathyarchaeota archaeon]MDW8061645.1 hypothetical protein [Nitrososphaerota archaeon]
MDIINPWLIDSVFFAVMNIILACTIMRRAEKRIRPRFPSPYSQVSSGEAP